MYMDNSTTEYMCLHSLSVVPISVSWYRS